MLHHHKRSHKQSMCFVCMSASMRTTQLHCNQNSDGLSKHSNLDSMITHIDNAASRSLNLALACSRVANVSMHTPEADAQVTDFLSHTLQAKLSTARRRCSVIYVPSPY